MFETAGSELRHHSNAGSDVIRPEPADPEDVAKKARSRRARLPRSQSAGNMLEAVGAPNKSVKYEPRDIPRESSEHRELRALAKFFRTTAPPTNNAHDNCMTLTRSGSPGSGDDSKLSIHAMMKRRRAAKRGTQSLQLQLSDKVIAKKTIEGYPYATIAIPHQQDADGPWFRSQYPVIPRSSSRGTGGPPQWPERTTSRGAPGPSAPTHGASTDNLGFKSHWSHQSLDIKAQSHEPSPDDLKNFTEARLQAASFLRRLAEDSLSTQDPETETQTGVVRMPKQDLAGAHQLQSPLLPSTIRNFDKHQPHYTTVEFPATPPPSGQLQEFQWPELVLNPAGVSPTASPKTLFTRQRQSSLSSSHAGSASPKSPRILQKPLSIATGRGLIVPQDNIQPESPGFPRMLAAMEFPSPPRVSRSPSSASTLSSRISSPSPAQFPPVVRPRTSSKGAMTTPSGPISLDEMIMRKTRSGLPRSQSDHALRKYVDIDLADRPVATNHGLGITTPSGVAGEIAQYPRRHVGSALLTDNTAHTIPNSSESAVITQEEYYVSRESPALGQSKSHRRSTSSVSTITAESLRRSTSTSNNRQSTRSNATTASTPPGLVVGDGVGGSYESMISNQPRVYAPVPDALRKSHLQSAVGKDVTYSDPGSTLSLDSAAGSATNKPLSIAERRMVRQRRSDGLRERSFDLPRSGPRPSPRTTTNPEAVDSPVLGWFSQSTVPTRKASLRGPSPLVRMSHTAAISEFIENQQEPGEVCLEMAVKAQESENAKTIRAMERGEEAVSDIVSVETPGNRAWSISPILATEIEPVPSAIFVDVKASNLTISPLMLVANIEPSDEHELAPKPTTHLRLSNIWTTETVAPSTPFKSPHRPRYTPKRLSLHIPLPVKIAGASSDISAPVIPSNGQLPGRSSLPSFPTTLQSKALKRFSLPTHVTGGQTPWTSWDRASFPRRGETIMAQHLEEESSSDEAEVLPRRRSSVIKERIHKEKMAKEKEIAELVANIATNTPKVEIQATTVNEDEEGKNYTTDDLELHLQRLEQNSDAWLSVLDPLLNNMASTLREVKKDGRGAPLLMGEFMIDMAAEARRSMLSIAAPEKTANTKSSVSFEGFDGAHPAANTRPKPAPAPEVDGSIRIKKSGRGRSPSNIARLRLPLDQPEKAHEVIQAVDSSSEESKRHQEAHLNDSGFATLATPERDSTENPRTPQQHEFEAGLAVRKRIQAQEIMMDELMSKWGMPTPRASQDSTRIVMAEPAYVQPQSPCEPETHSRSSSLDTAKPTIISGSKSNDLDTTPLDLINSPMANIRRGSRRWSSAGERASWKPGDSSFMNVLIHDLKESSRISLESTADIQSLLL
ncbi:hypothetical protein BKA67DRAFT_540959 [Truncatella angustata]|uniref:Uncharacterized protein n=1 Tax=Truncatella angustata TaxID=152316 RepID=A0A9P8UBX0_9PEZI|nr:uncharacterized protein BKA67DRAFT_540959 [Truncatella angustata]KAH6645966.1 hypothetical protein BKA67DRAFT_540959 [Truncatella angustata]